MQYKDGDLNGAQAQEKYRSIITFFTCFKILTLNGYT